MRKDSKLDRNYEHKIVLMAQDRIRTGNYKIFDDRARIITRKDVEGVGENCLIICNENGDTIVMDDYFERKLKNALKWSE